MLEVLCTSLSECAGKLRELSLSGNVDLKSGGQSWDDVMPRIAALIVTLRHNLKHLNLEGNGITVCVFVCTCMFVRACVELLLAM